MFEPRWKPNRLLLFAGMALALAVVLASCSEPDIKEPSQYGSDSQVYSESAFVEVSAGGFHSCGLRDNGTVECWGINDHGQSSDPYGQFQSVSAGKEHSCGVRVDGTVDCWGNHAQSGSPEGVFVEVSAGKEHSCGVRPDGTVDCWGYQQ